MSYRRDTICVHEDKNGRCRLKVKRGLCTKKDRLYCHYYIFKSWRPKAKSFIQMRLGKKYRKARR